MLTVSGIKLIASIVNLIYVKIEHELENDIRQEHSYSTSIFRYAFTHLMTEHSVSNFDITAPDALLSYHL